jgi:hypothetical protein
MKFCSAFSALFMMKPSPRTEFQTQLDGTDGVVSGELTEQEDAEPAPAIEAPCAGIAVVPDNSEVTGYQVYEDENQSGTKNSRPALDKMMADVREGRIETVLVYSFSSFARSTTHLLSALEEFRKLGVKFVSITE